MLEMYDFTITQMRYIKAAMDEVAAFRPDFKSPSDVAAMIPTPDTVRSDYLTKMTAASAARDARNFGADNIHAVCVDFLAQGRSVYRNNPAVLEQLGRIIIKDESFQQCLTRGDQSSALWATLPNVGTPPAAFVVKRIEGDVTKSQFDTLITTARAADVALPAADQDFQHAEADLHVKHNTLADFVTAALQQGRSQFAPGSAEREVIDAIPSFPATQPPDQAVIDEAVLIDSGTARIRYHADGATSYDVLYLAPGATDYITLTEDNIAKEYLVTVTPGDNKIKVVGRNSRGPGPESEVTTVPAT